MISTYVVLAHVVKVQYQQESESERFVVQDKVRKNIFTGKVSKTKVIYDVVNTSMAGVPVEISIPDFIEMQDRNNCYYDYEKCKVINLAKVTIYLSDGSNRTKRFYTDARMNAHKASLISKLGSTIEFNT